MSRARTDEQRRSEDELRGLLVAVGAPAATPRLPATSSLVAPLHMPRMRNSAVYMEVTGLRAGSLARVALLREQVVDREVLLLLVGRHRPC